MKVEQQSDFLQAGFWFIIITCLFQQKIWPYISLSLMNILSSLGPAQLSRPQTSLYSSFLSDVYTCGFRYHPFVDSNRVTYLARTALLSPNTSVWISSNYLKLSMSDPECLSSTASLPRCFPHSSHLILGHSNSDLPLAHTRNEVVILIASLPLSPST